MSTLLRLADEARRGEVTGIAAVVDRGGMEHEYIGTGTTVRDRLRSYATVMKLAAKFL